MFSSEFDILKFCFQEYKTQEKQEIKDGILIKRIENLPCQKSQSVEAIGYDHTYSVFYIQFKNGNTRGYYNVPLTLWQRFLNRSGSLEKLYDQCVKGEFRGGMVDNLVNNREENLNGDY